MPAVRDGYAASVARPDSADLAALEPAIGPWIVTSPRFRTFADANAAKIAKKLRGAPDAATRRDVIAELRVAHLLLADRRIDLGFEPYGSGKGGPDFGVHFRTSPAFDLEVTRPRRPPDATALGWVLLAKLRQLRPSVAGVVLVVTDLDDATGVDIGAAARSLRAHADRGDPTVLTAVGADRPKAFYDRYLRLGGVVVLADGARGDARAAWWPNASARIAVPSAAIRAAVATLRAGAPADDADTDG
jgi:hypothetical protein